ncbi:equilibrative nucleoside transporter [Nesidiocoris tenuis]|uniref:Equilibrative nucleoside transporter n=1 Tax=Nesidiocoris tenuis TaxID=355587 RepID=A0ABN7AX99_9HEMI|nr:equilibrative nucleoside transporter [Nesidiocoris tenuis]
MAMNGMNRRGQDMPEEQMLLGETSKANIINSTANGKIGEKTTFLTPEPVRLTPAWEETNLTNDELNFKGVTMEQAQLETNPPKDRWKIVYLILILHGMGTLMPWNMFINAKSYFVDYKLSANYTGLEEEENWYAKDFLSYLGIAAQGPNLLFNWANIFIQIGGKLTTRIVWSIVVEMLCFIVTVVLAMTESSAWPDVFFYSTMLIVVILNMANGIYQNTVYGMAAKLPPAYTGAIILGANVSGMFSSLISIGSLAVAPNPRTAAIYYFITALFILSLCFDTYFALPLNRFYKYHELMSQKAIQKKVKETANGPLKVPYWRVFKECSGQCFNIFFTFFVTLAVFPAIDSAIKKYDPDFIINDKYYVEVMCFLTFNVGTAIGSMLPGFGSWPGPRWLWIPVVLRFAFIPLFLLCNYRPPGVERTLQVLIPWDWAYFGLGSLLGLSSGYYSSVAMMYCPGTVSSPQYTSTASMFGAACIITGICAGIATSFVFPWIVSNVTLPL